MPASAAEEEMSKASFFSQEEGRIEVEGEEEELVEEEDLSMDMKRFLV